MTFEVIFILLAVYVLTKASFGFSELGKSRLRWQNPCSPQHFCEIFIAIFKNNDTCQIYLFIQTLLFV